MVGSDMKGDVFLRNTATGDVGMWVMNGARLLIGGFRPGVAELGRRRDRRF